MDSYDWLEKLQVGDSVFTTEGLRRHFTRHKVTKVTKHRITTESVTSHPYEWRRKDGRLVGSTGYNIPTLYPWSDQNVATYRRQQALVRFENKLYDLQQGMLKDRNTNSFTYDQLKIAGDALEEAWKALGLEKS